MNHTSDNSGEAIEARLRNIEDTLEIYNLIATHPPFADTGAMQHARRLWADDAVFKRSDGQGDMTVADMESHAATPAHSIAMDGGLAHFCGHPYVRVSGDTAMAISYLQLLTPSRDGKPMTLSGHGTSNGYFVHKVVVNKWDLIRTPKGWRVHNRIASSLNGAKEPRDLLASVFED